MGLKPLYIFDLDGTLALIDHRRHFIADKKNQRWDEFYWACIDDQPNKPVIKILESLIYSSSILIFSGRSDIVAFQTAKWLSRQMPKVGDFYCANILKMRKHGDYTPDHILKKKWYEELSQEDKDRLACVFDDRQKVVDMWRSLGITCLQVASGDF